MMIRLPNGGLVDTEKTSWAQGLSDDDYYYCEQIILRDVVHNDNCMCQQCIDEDSALIDSWERSQAFRNQC